MFLSQYRLQHNLVKDFDADVKLDLLLGGNFYAAKPEAGCYDASYCLFLKGDSKGNFKAVNDQQSGIQVKGQVRDIVELQTGKKSTLFFIMNNDKPKLFEYSIKKQ